ncbi:MAG: phosphate regulon transcriptional regulator PhoB [Pseudomonadales bacterium]|nr:phosphate regulon transcriptional regulator PhoB [Pseudomonadales bacterium]
MSHNILIVEDEPSIREMLRFSLERAGYSVEDASDAEEALEYLSQKIPHLVLIDWMLPGLSGVELVRKIREDKTLQELPVMMLTARGEEADKLMSFERGVDDYMTKPFSPKELLARIKALLRRSGHDESGVLEIGDIHLDTRAHRLSVCGESVHIGPTEYKMLEFLMRNQGRVFSREQLLDHVWGRTIYVEERTVDVHILRVRKLLAPHGCDSMIQTVRGAGYRLSIVES